MSAKTWVFNVVAYMEAENQDGTTSKVNWIKCDVGIDGVCEEHARRRVIKHIHRKGGWVKSVKLASGK